MLSVSPLSRLAPAAGLLQTAREIAPARNPGSGGKRSAHARLLPLVWITGAALFAFILARGGGRFLHALERALDERWQLVLLGAALEALSIAGYVLLLHRVIGRRSAGTAPLRLKDSYDITLAGTAATRFLPTAGLGGAAVTVWALRARGVRATDITERMLAFLVLLYAVYVSALLASGLIVATGLVHVAGGARVLGVVGATLALVLTAAVLTLLAAPRLAARLLDRLAGAGNARIAAGADKARQHLPALRAALTRAHRELRRPHPALLGAVAWWGFDIGVLATMLHVFGVSLPLPAIVLAYFLGTLLNLLPLPGSLSSGLGGSLVALGAAAAPALAAVLAYRAVAVWLPAASGLTSFASLRTSVARWRAEAQSGAVIRTATRKLAV